MHCNALNKVMQKTPATTENGTVITAQEAGAGIKEINEAYLNIPVMVQYHDQYRHFSGPL